MVTSQVDDAALVGKRRQQIVAAALKLFARQGYFRTTIKDVAKAAKVSPGLIYQYVRDKEDVLLLVLLDCVSRYGEELPAAAEREADPLARLRAAYAAYCRVVDANKAAAVMAYRSTKSLDSERRQLVMAEELKSNALLARYVQGCVDAGYFRQVNIDLVTYQLVMAAHAWALKAWFFATRFTIDGYIAQTFDIVANGLLTDAGRQALTQPHRSP
jgi:AcrR family transcriptional regulator